MITGALVVAGELALNDQARAEPPPSPGPAPVPSIAASHPKPKEDPKPDEIRVQGHRREVGGTTMRREEAREIPGAFGDPARFVEAMPGVVPTTSGLQAFYIRGAPPETTGYFIDGVPVPVLYHIGFGPSVIHPGPRSIASSSSRARRRLTSGEPSARQSKGTRRLPRRGCAARRTCASSTRARSSSRRSPRAAGARRCPAATAIPGSSCRSSRRASA